MADDAEQAAALLTALTTEHFVLQSAASTTVSEATGRSGLYMSALSSALIAIGFATSQPHLLGPLLAVTAPIIFVLGVFTVIRLVDTGVSNVVALSQIARIREHYRTLSHDAPHFFPASGDLTDQALASLGTRAAPLTGLFTLASMIATVNSAVAGIGTGLLLCRVAPDAVWGALLLGVLVFAALMVAFLRYQSFRYVTISS